GIAQERHVAYVRTNALEAAVGFDRVTADAAQERVDAQVRAQVLRAEEAVRARAQRAHVEIAQEVVPPEEIDEGGTRGLFDVNEGQERLRHRCRLPGGKGGSGRARGADSCRS